MKAAAQVRIATEDADTIDAIETHQAETVDRPPGSDEGIPPSKTYAPLSFPVIALLMQASVFGVLARLGLVALMNYDGRSVFALAYAQAVGCLVMGFGVGLKEPFGQMYVFALVLVFIWLNYLGMGPFIRRLRQVQINCYLLVSGFIY